jgi:hypothetical protein
MNIGACTIYPYFVRNLIYVIRNMICIIGNELQLILFIKLAWLVHRGQNLEKRIMVYGPCVIREIVFSCLVWMKWKVSDPSKYSLNQGQTLIEERRRPTGPGRDRTVVEIMTICVISAFHH